MVQVTEMTVTLITTPYEEDMQSDILNLEADGYRDSSRKTESSIYSLLRLTRF